MGDLNRRQFLGFTGATAAAVLIPSPALAAPGRKKRPRPTTTAWNRSDPWVRSEPWVR